MKKRKLSEYAARGEYNDYLDELYPLEGIACNPLSLLLAKGDETAYDVGFEEWCNNNNVELEG